MADCTNVVTRADADKALLAMQDLNTFIYSTSNTFVDSEGTTRLTAIGIVNYVPPA